MTLTDRIRTRRVQNLLKLAREHLEAMERDTHGLEYMPWHREVQHMWKQVFQQINPMSPAPQQAALEMIREQWTTYLTYYATIEAP